MLGWWVGSSSPSTKSLRPTTVRGFGHRSPTNTLNRGFGPSIWLISKSVVYLEADTLLIEDFGESLELPFAFKAAFDVYLDGRGFAVGLNASIQA